MTSNNPLSQKYELANGQIQAIFEKTLPVGAQLICRDASCMLSANEEQKIVNSGKEWAVYLCNTALNSDPHGLHWLIFITGGRQQPEKIFFDSYGRHPTEFPKGNIKKFVPTWYNELDYQAKNTVVCGVWCIYFTLHFTQNRRNILKETFIGQKDWAIANQKICMHNDMKLLTWFNKFLNQNKLTHVLNKTFTGGSIYHFDRLVFLSKEEEDDKITPNLEW